MQTFSCKSLVVVFAAALCTTTTGSATGDEPLLAPGLGQMHQIAQRSSMLSENQILHFDVVVHVTVDAQSLQVLDTWAEMQDIFIEGWPESQLETDPGYPSQLIRDQAI